MPPSPSPIPTQPAPTRLLNSQEAADVLGVTPACLEKWRIRRSSPLRWVRVGRCVRYRVSDLEAFITSATEASTANVGVEVCRG